MRFRTPKTLTLKDWRVSSGEASSRAPSRMKPAALMRISNLPWILWAEAMMVWSSERGWVTSRSTVVRCQRDGIADPGSKGFYLRVTAPFSLRSDILVLSRAVAITLWPRLRASSAMPLPKPLDAALTKYTSGAILMSACSAVEPMWCAGVDGEGESGLGWARVRFK